MSKPVCYASRGDDSDGSTKIEADSVQAPCGGSSTNVTSCCISDHECQQDGICRFRDNTGTKTSGYYIGGCTDESFNDPACSKNCINFNQHDIIYTGKVWNCCWKTDISAIDCTNPSDQTFYARPPESLSKAPDYTPYSSTRSASSTSSAAASSTSSPPTDSSSPNPVAVSAATATPSPSSQGLGSGAKAGIGVGVSVGALVVIAILAFSVLKRRRRRQTSPQIQGYAGEKQQEQFQTAPLVPPGELDANREPELDGVPRSELGSGSRLGR